MLVGNPEIVKAGRVGLIGQRNLRYYRPLDSSTRTRFHGNSENRHP